MDWLATALAVTAGVTACVYRRWWKDATRQLEISRRATRTLSRRLGAYRVRAAADLDATPDATPDDQGGATP